MESKKFNPAADQLRTADEAPKPAAKTKPPGRHDDPAYAADQAEQRRTPTRFDNTRYRRKQDAGNAR